VTLALAPAYRPDDRQLAEIFAEMRSAIGDLERGIEDRANATGRRWSLTASHVIDQGQGTQRDGFPRTGARPPPPAPNRPPNPDPEADGGHTAYGDTVGGIATASDTPEVRRSRELVSAIRAARDALRAAVAVLVAATPAQQHPRIPDLDSCRVCSRAGHPVPIYHGSRGAETSERCEWCYRFWLLWGTDVPPAILKLRHQGKRVTENAIRAELGELAG
jgi:hypothetical protein